MSGYAVIMRTPPDMPMEEKKRRARNLSRSIKRHPGIINRTYELNTSIFVRVYDDLNLIMATAEPIQPGSNVSYASFLEEGTRNRNGSQRIRPRRFMIRPCERMFGTDAIVFAGKIA